MHTELVDMPRGRALAQLAWPMVLFGLMRSAYQLTDAAFVSWLGDDALAGLGAATFGWWMLVICTEAASVGTQTVVAQAAGARKHHRVGALGVQGLWAVAAITVAILLTGPLTLHGYLWALDLQPGAVSEAAWDYLLASGWSVGALGAHAVIGAVYRGLGRNQEALRIEVVAVVLNVLFDPFGIWGMGIAGAAWATGLAHGFGTLAGLWGLRKGGVVLSWKGPDPQVIRRIIGIGAPMAASGMAFSAVYVVLARFIEEFGSYQLAALAIGHRLESLPFRAAVGMETASATLVGQLVGAGRPAEAVKAGRYAARWAAVLIVPFGVVLAVTSPWTCAWFASEPATAQAAAVYLSIQTLGFPFLALEVVHGGNFSGTGRTRPNLLIAGVGTAVRIPMAYGLAATGGLGVTGVWVAILVSTIGKGIVLDWAFPRFGLPSEG